MAGRLRLILRGTTVDQVTTQNQTQALATTTLPIEGPGGLGVENPGDFARQLRRYLDDLNHLKFLDHLEVDLSSASSAAEEERLRYYRAEADRVRISIWKSAGHFEDSLVGLQQLFTNIDLYLRYPDIADLGFNQPFEALVIAAGPSLDESLRVIKQRRPSHLIVCVDAALKACLEADIIPHIVTVIERDEHSLKFVKNLPKDISTVLVAHPLCKRDIFDAYPGPKVMASKLTGPFLWFPFKRSHFISGSSSAHLAYQVAAQLGAQKIALIGQDLCFHPETLQSHGNISDYPQWSQPNQRENLLRHMNPHDALLEVPGNTYASVLTTSTWQLFAEDFEAIIASRAIPTVNTSRLGRKLRSAPYEPLEGNLRAAIQGPPQNLRLPPMNPRYAAELDLVKTKLTESAKALETIEYQIRETLRHEIVSADFYDRCFLQSPFLELGFEVVFRDWLEAENLILSGPPELVNESRRKVLSQAEQAAHLSRQILNQSSKMLE